MLLKIIANYYVSADESHLKKSTDLTFMSSRHYGIQHNLLFFVSFIYCKQGWTDFIINKITIYFVMQAMLCRCYIVNIVKPWHKIHQLTLLAKHTKGLADILHLLAQILNKSVNEHKPLYPINNNITRE